MSITEQHRGVVELAELLRSDRDLLLPEGTEAVMGAARPELQARLAALGIQAYLGRPAFVGRSASGASNVQFNIDGGGGYSSAWPEWAYEVARIALTSGKRLWVLANGDPFGHNLVQVMVLAQ